MDYEYTLPKNGIKITTIEAHTAGEPLRIIVDGFPKIQGKTILEKRAFIRDNYDHLRKVLMWEPRGHSDMYGALLVAPEKKNSDIGVIFLHNEGYSTMCGHGIIALTKVILDTEIIKKTGIEPELRIDTPAGLIIAKGYMRNGQVEKVSFLNVPSFVLQANKKIKLPGIGIIYYDIAFGGAFYVFCNADQFNFRLIPSEARELIHFGKTITDFIQQKNDITHPLFSDLGFLYGTIFIGQAHDQINHSRNVCIFADGELDRSPTGTGVSARAAIHYARGEINPNQEISIEGILDTVFKVKVLREDKIDQYKAIIPKVTGEAYIIGENRFYLDPADPLKGGFFIR